MNHRQSYLSTILLVSLTLFFGLQAFRVFLPEVIWYLGMSLSPTQLALFALVVFSTACLAPVLHMAVGERGLLLLTAGGMALAYLGFQIVHSAPVYLYLGTVGVVLWGWFLSFWQASTRNRPGQGTPPVLAIAFPLAFLLDTVLRVLHWGYDLAWRHTWASLAVSLVLSFVAIVMLWIELRQPAKESTHEPGWKRSLPLMGIGPFLYLAMSVVHNPAAYAVASGVDDAQSYLWTGLFTALGAIACVQAAGTSGRRRFLLAVLNGLTLIAALAFSQVHLGEAWSLALFPYGLTAITLWAALGLMLSGISQDTELKPGLWRTALATFLALLLMLVILFLISQFELYWMAVVAGGILWISSFWATAGARASRQPDVPRPAQIGLALVVSLVIGGVVSIFAWVSNLPPSQTIPRAAPEGSLRVMTYNIHQGVDADLKVDLVAIAAAIANQTPDVVALNEVNRARATNGFMDVLPLISRHLGMDYVFGANYEDGQYGNAIFSRYPIVEWNNTHYMVNTTEVRGALRAVIATPAGEVTIFATHLDHIVGADNARAAQVQELLALWDGQPRSVILGDMNTEPDKPELAALYAQGLTDVLRAAGQDQAFTFWDPVPQPGKRIDFIFVTPDLKVSNAWVPQTRASDHLPVVTEFVP